MKVELYVLPSGRVPVKEFLDGLQARLRAETFRALELIETEGLRSGSISTRHIRGKLWEIRVTAGGQVRVFYFVRKTPGEPERIGHRADMEPGEVEEESVVVLLHGYVKKSQKAPTREIQLAERRLREADL